MLIAKSVGLTVEMEFFVAILSILFLSYCYWKYATSTKNLPPGPVGIPFLGYISPRRNNQHLLMSKLAAKYGDIFSFYIGQKLFVVLSSYAVVKEALIKQGKNFAARPFPPSIIPPEFKETKGIFQNSGELFNEFKQITLSVMKTLTRSDGNGESIVMNEIHCLMREISQHQGKPVDISELIFHSTASIIWFCLLAERGDKNDDMFKAMVHNAQKRTKTALLITGIDIAFPQIFKIPFVTKILQICTAMECNRSLHKCVNDKISEIATSEKLKTEFNFAQKWLKLQPRESADYDFYQKQLPPVLTDLFAAGFETTAIFLQWALLYMMQYPDIQKKVQKEINDIIGKSNKPSMEYKNKMPFTEATLAEVHRMSPVLPVSLPHMNTETSSINGYTIPENSVIISNVWGIHHNPEIFPEPEAFRPERFLENDKFKKIEELIPFSIGTRQCMGEALARMEIFLIFTSLLQRYTFKKPEGVQLDFAYDFSILTRPRPYKVIAIQN